MAFLHYLAYGSNLHPLRLSRRVPSAEAIGTIELAGRWISFHKRSVDGSGKCNLIDATNKIAYGVIYKILASEKEKLDRAEGLGNGYHESVLNINFQGNDYSVFSYFAEPTHIDERLCPYDWYKGMVVAGAKHHGFPNSYIQNLECLPAIPDPDNVRATKENALLQRMSENSNLDV